MFLKNGGAALAYNPCIPSISFYSHLPLGSWMVGNPLFTNKPVAKGHLWFNDWVWMGTLCQCELGENPGTDWIIHLELQHSWVDRVRIWRHFKHPRIRASLQHWSKKYLAHPCAAIQNKGNHIGQLAGAALFSDFSDSPHGSCVCFCTFSQAIMQCLWDFLEGIKDSRCPTASRHV